jgi:hypothetical protein
LYSEAHIYDHKYQLFSLYISRDRHFIKSIWKITKIHILYINATNYFSKTVLFKIFLSYFFNTTKVANVAIPERDNEYYLMFFQLQILCFLHYYVQINPALHYVKRIKLLGLFLPLSNQTVNIKNNQIYFTDGTNNFIISLPTGIYNSITLPFALENALNSVMSGFTVVWNDQLLRLIFSNSTLFGFNWGIFQNNSIAKYLRFPFLDTTLVKKLSSIYVVNLSVSLCYLY